MKTLVNFASAVCAASGILTLAAGLALTSGQLAGAGIAYLLFAAVLGVMRRAIS